MLTRLRVPRTTVAGHGLAGGADATRLSSLHSAGSPLAAGPTAYSQVSTSVMGRSATAAASSMEDSTERAAEEK